MSLFSGHTGLQISPYAIHAPGAGGKIENNVVLYSPAPAGQRFLLSISGDIAKPPLSIISHWQKASAAGVKDP